jgi:putative DNA-invertase from lambdoid prophage Rac
MRLAYYRVSTGDQSTEIQRREMGGRFDREFDEGDLSGAVEAAKRPEFSKLLEVARAGDELHVYSVDRLGRDALDIQATARRLIRAGVVVHVHGLGPLTGDVGELILAVLAQVADGERRRIIERTAAGRRAARAALASTGRTHRGKDRLGGRPPAADPVKVEEWRVKHRASIARTAAHFGLSRATVKRYRAAGAQIDLEDAIRTSSIDGNVSPAGRRR